MRILVLTSRLPFPPDRGDRLRVYNFLRSLARQHTITLVSFIEKPDERRNIIFLEPFCEKVFVIELSPIRSILTVALNFWRELPLQVLYYRSGSMAKLIETILADGNFDIIYTHLVRMAPYVENLKTVYRIIDLTDLISKEIQLSLKYRKLLSRIVFRLEEKRLGKYETEVIIDFDEAWLISESEYRSAKILHPNANLQLVKNGVDVSIYHPLEIERLAQRLIFVGHLSVFHNVDAATYLVEHILPPIREQIPEVEVVIVGQDPSPQVISLDKNPAVKVMGYVEDLNHTLNQASVFVAPLRFAAGVQNKVLEAMATGTPVVTTPLVVAGIGAIPGHDLIAANLDDEIVLAIIDLLNNPDKAHRIGRAGYLFARNNYSWDLVLQRLNEIGSQLNL